MVVTHVPITSLEQGLLCAARRNAQHPRTSGASQETPAAGGQLAQNLRKPGLDQAYWTDVFVRHMPCSVEMAYDTWSFTCAQRCFCSQKHTA